VEGGPYSQAQGGKKGGRRFITWEGGGKKLVGLGKFRKNTEKKKSRSLKKKKKKRKESEGYFWKGIRVSAKGSNQERAFPQNIRERGTAGKVLPLI